MLQEGPGQAGIGDADKQQLSQRGRNRNLDPALPAQAGTGQGYYRLGNREAKCDDHREMTDFRYHCDMPSGLWMSASSRGI